MLKTTTYNPIIRELSGGSKRINFDKLMGSRKRKSY